MKNKNVDNKNNRNNWMILLTIIGVLILIPIIVFSSLNFYVNHSIKQQIGNQLDCPQLNKQIDTNNEVKIFSEEFDDWVVDSSDKSTEIILSCKEEFVAGKKIVCSSDKISSLTKSIIVTTPKIMGKQKEITINASYHWIINSYNANGLFEKTLCKRTG